MIAFYGCIGVALLLFVLLFLLGSGSAKDELDVAGGDSPDRREASCPAGVVKQIFSPQDLDFVARERSLRLQRFFVSERRRIAMRWIRRTSAELSRAIQLHVRSAREAEDLEAYTEAKVLFQYVQLRCVCGLLLLSAILVRPSLLQEIAVYASALSHRLDFSRTKLEGRRAVPVRMRGNQRV
jgi:ribosomal protein S18